jgi:ketosteroid isomerase-like protein
MNSFVNFRRGEIPVKRMFLIIALVAASPLAVRAIGDDSVRRAVDAYDQAVAKKDVETVKKLLAPEMLLYEHSVRNDGAKDAFENHLKPEILEGDGLQLSFSDLRVTENSGLALVTRQYRVKGTFDGKAIDSAGNETQVWKKTDEGWKILHIHYSHACPRTKAAS